MKTLNEIWAAHARALMRCNAMIYRSAICATSKERLTRRGIRGVYALIFAIEQRNEALYYEGQVDREKKVEKDQIAVDTIAASRQYGTCNEHTTETPRPLEKDRLLGR